MLAADATSTDFLESAEAFRDETDLSVWQRIIGGLGSLDRLVDGSARERLRERVRALVGPALARLGPDRVDGESDRDRELRGVLLEAMGVLGDDADAKARARDLYRQETAGTDVDPSLFAAAVHIIASDGTADDFDEFLRRFRAASTPQEELRFLSVLADFDDPDLARRLLTMSLTDDVRTQNAPYLLRRALSNREQGKLAWFFVQDEWDAINERFPSNSIVRMLEGVRSLSTPDIAPEVFVFFETHEVPQGDKSLAQHLERLEVNVALRGTRVRAAHSITCADRGALTTVRPSGGRVRQRPVRGRGGRCWRPSWPAWPRSFACPR